MSIQGNAAAASTLPPSLGAADLYQLAQSDPRMWAAIATHPNAYPDLLDWLERVGPQPVKDAVAQRRNAPALERKAVPPAAGIPVARPAPSGGPVMRPAPTDRPVSRPAPVAAAFAPPEASSPVRTGNVAPARRVSPAPGRVQPAPSTRTDVAGGESHVEQPAADRTVLAKRSKRAKTLALLDWGGGVPTLIVKEEVVIGRRVPRVFRTEGTQVVELEDATKTVSATHARLKRVDGKWFIEDLDSTNGIYLVEEDGGETEVDKLSPVTQKFYLGDVLFHLEPKG